MNSYIINSNTLAIIYENEKSKIYENDRVFFINTLPTNIIKDSCLYYGSSLEGRMKSCKSMLGISYKCPVVINEFLGNIFFPTSCASDKNCSWINYNNILNYYMCDKYRLNIVFKNQISLIISISMGSFDRQVLRSSRLLNVFNSRK